MNKPERIKELVAILQNASIAYYKYDSPIMSDKEYDSLFDELTRLEKHTGIILAGSPTQKVQGYLLDGFDKIEHSKPMLSAAKTKDPEEIKKFLGGQEWYCSYKLDGGTVVLRYENGELIQGITRGNGLIGEDITEQCKCISNIPLKIPYKDYIEVRGECVISWKNFNDINNTLDKPYSNPRNLATGSLRQLDLDIVKSRKLSFVVFEVIEPILYDKLFALDRMEHLGFEVVKIEDTYNVDDCINNMKPNNYKYPTDGLVFEFRNNEYSRSLGATAHHENCRMALKWEDDLYPTKLKDIEWTMGKTGVLTPAIVFEPVEIDGTIVQRASVHNVSILKQLHFTNHCTCYIYKANMIIPQCDHTDDDGDSEIKIPTKCPICGAPTEIRQDNDTEILVCTDSRCEGKLLGKLIHFCSKNAMNIEGLSEETLKKLLDECFVRDYIDIYELKAGFYNDIINLPGFNKRSTDNLMNSIEKSKHTTLDRFLYSLSIPLIGRTASKTISNYFNGDFDKFWEEVCTKKFNFKRLNDFGEKMAASIGEYIDVFHSEIEELASYMTFEVGQKKDKIFDGLIFVITGSVNHFKNRDEMKEKIESFGGKVTGSVSSKTSYLVNNDINSNSSKNRKAKSLGVPIITEEQFLAMIK